MSGIKTEMSKKMNIAIGAHKQCIQIMLSQTLSIVKV